MATPRKSTKAAVLEDVTEEVEVEATEAELTEKQIINEAITRVLGEVDVDGQHSRYKAMRAIAYQAFVNAIFDGSFEDLVDEAIGNVDTLPSGWELARAEKAEAPAPKAVKAKAVKPVAEKPAAAAKTPAKRATAKSATTTAPARKRPAR